MASLLPTVNVPFVSTLIALVPPETIISAALSESFASPPPVTLIAVFAVLIVPPCMSNVPAETITIAAVGVPTELLWTIWPPPSGLSMIVSVLPLPLTVNAVAVFEVSV